MHRCAERWRELLLAAGAQKAEIMPSEGHPFVYAEYSPITHSEASNSPEGVQYPIGGTPSNSHNIASLVRLLFLWSLGVGAVFTVVFALSYMPMYRMMTSDAVVLERLKDFTLWLIAMPIVSTLAFMWDGVFTGATAGKQIRNAMIWAAVGFVLGYVASYHWLGTHALFVGYFLHLAARVIYLTATWRPLVERQSRLFGPLTSNL
jgi:MATE family multidrug resistance protein